MQYSVSPIISFIIFILKINYGQFSDYGWYQAHNYRFFPRLGDCYEIYEPNEIVTAFTCQNRVNLKRQSCIDLIPGNEQCLGLKTPTNETIEFTCKNTHEETSAYYKLYNCFKIHKVDETFEEVCQRKFDEYSIGITTPDNFTVIFESNLCSTSISIDGRKKFEDFAKNYLFDPGLKSCYKVFNPNQFVSPYTCLSKDVHDSCIHELPNSRNCTGITTQNNETVVLDCADKSGEKSPERNCFKIYTPDGNVHFTCQKKIEERCIGILTPSNLTVLLDCLYCPKPNNKYSNDVDATEKRKYRQFVKSYLNKEYKGENSYLETIAFEVFAKNEFVDPLDCVVTRRPKFYGYWLPNTNCYGLTLESNETIILECTSKEKRLKPGCFQVVNSEHEEAIICARVLDELCVGITTPMNLSVVLACYPHKCFTGNAVGSWKRYANQSIESFQLTFDLHRCYEVYGKNEEVSQDICKKKAKPENYACIDWITEEKHCIGLKTPQNETIELTCSTDGDFVTASFFGFNKIPSCVHVYSPKGNVQQVCQQKFGNHSIGITTPNNNSIVFNSYFCKTYKELYEIKEYKNFIENFSFNPDIRSCYKIFKQDQDISPHTCLSMDVHEECIHQLQSSTCTGIKTQNNETVVLHCPDDGRKMNKSGCFDIYTSDNKVHKACQMQLEERCIGITTPSNLSVLFECYSCMSTRVYNNLPFYQLPYRKELHKFVESALHSYTQGYYTIKTSYIVYTEEGYREKETVQLLRGHNNCRGLRLMNFETIVLECPNKIPKKNGCFDVYTPKPGKIRNSPEQQVHNVCIRVLDERCIGFMTPNNWTIALECIFHVSTNLQPAAAVFVPHNGKPPRV